ncbi:MAG TPA: alpha/beta fold hydrolase [Kofleriaceae bacterium]|jgi:dienelactone hydrolase
MTATHEPRRGEPAGAEISEDVVRFGNADQLVGIVSRPDRTHATRDTPSVVILNAGVIHRVGPHRLHVVLARRLAELGFATLRLDLGGIGDSVASSDATTFRDSAVADTRLALAGLGAKRYVIFGVCAGADNALATALVDDRVAAIVLVDPYVYANRRGQLRAAVAKVRALGPREALVRGVRAAERIAKAKLAQRYARDPDEPDQAGGREAPPIASYRADLGKLVARGVRVLAIYSGVHGAKYNAPDQLFELFPELRGKIDRAYFPHANHTFTELDVQHELVATTASWIARLAT